MGGLSKGTASGDGMDGCNGVTHSDSVGIGDCSGDGRGFYYCDGCGHIACHGYGCGNMYAAHGFASSSASGDGSGSFEWENKKLQFLRLGQ